jgi:hypothetical protein
LDGNYFDRFGGWFNPLVGEQEPQVGAAGDFS